MKNWLVGFMFGETWDRSGLPALGIVDHVRTYKGETWVHIQPVFWAQGSPLPRWLPTSEVVVLNDENADAPAFAEAS